VTLEVTSQFHTSVTFLQEWTWYPLNRMPDGVQSKCRQFWRCKNLLRLLKLETQTIQSIALSLHQTHYPDCQDTQCAQTNYLHIPVFYSICGHPETKQLQLKCQIKIDTQGLWNIAIIFRVKQLGCLPILTSRLGFKPKALHIQSKRWS
jgi:hypothetical protein